MFGRPGRTGSDWKRLTGFHGRVEAAGTAGGKCSLLEGQGHQDLPEEEQPAQSTRGKFKRILFKSSQHITVSLHHGQTLT